MISLVANQKGRVTADPAFVSQTPVYLNCGLAQQGSPQKVGMNIVAATPP